jgi:hypothetical protein
MNYIIESIFVGLYSACVYLFFSYFIHFSYKNMYLLLLLVGFFKHFLGYILSIHTWYCNNGEACLKIPERNERYIASSVNLLRDSILEAIYYLFLGLILRNIAKDVYLFFMIGFILHILSEKLKIHTYFCVNYCNKS